MSGEILTINEIADALDVRRQSADARSKREAWPFETVNGRGDRRFHLLALPADVQTAIAARRDIPPELIPALAPEAALEASKRLLPIPAFNIGIASTVPAWTAETAIGPGVLNDARVRRIAGIVHEALKAPRGVKKRAWIEQVAARHGMAFQTVYRHIAKYEKQGLAGLKHTKGNRRQPKAWTPEAIDWWVGLCLKKEHRKMAKDVLYAILQQEARTRDWQVGGYRSALWWLEKRVTPQLRALQRGGVRALDNTLPPVLRDYADLEPFEILVGDQHKFDFWVVDEETGEVFRPEGYFWQDLRSRAFYGGALDKKYDSYLMGLSLRMGLKLFGPFLQIYTDHGKPEESRYIMGILRDMRAIGLQAMQTVDANIDFDGCDPEEVNPLAIQPGTHRKAIVRNAKAKMIEGTFSVFEGILRDHFRVPGHVKELGGLQEENEVDQQEIERLAQSGKLLTFGEFFLTVLQAMDYYNSRKPHRGVLREWAGRPKPKSPTPMDCLKACYMAGWRTTRLSDAAIDLIFLPRASRVVDRGRITFRNEVYESEALIGLAKSKRVEVRFDPLDPDYILIFDGQEFICRAEPVEYSSMKDQDLAQRKIEEKRRRRKGFILEYRRLTSAVPDFQAHSKVPAIEKAAAIIKKAEGRRLKAEGELYRERTAEELEAEVAALEEKGEAESSRLKAQRRGPLPRRPSYFMNEYERYSWIVKFEVGGGEVREDDREFKAEYEGKMKEGEREYWEAVRAVGEEMR